MKIVDIILALLLIFGAWRGFRKGLFLEIITFLAFIVAIVSAFKLLNTGMEYLQNEWGWQTMLLPFIAFIAIFVLVFFAIHLLGKVLKKIVDYTLLGSIDNLVGAGIGILKMAFALSLVLWLTRVADLEIPKHYTENTWLFPTLIDFAPHVVHWISYVIPFQDIFPAIKKLFELQ